MKKPIRVLMILSIIFAALSYLLFIVGTITAQSMGTNTIPFDKAFGSAFLNFPALFSFKEFHGIVGFAVLAFLAVLWLAWLIVTIVGKKKHSVAPMIVGLPVFFALFIMGQVFVFDIADYIGVTKNNSSLLMTLFRSLSAVGSNLVLVVFCLSSFAFGAIALLLAVVEAFVDMLLPECASQEVAGEISVLPEQVYTADQLEQLIQEPASEEAKEEQPAEEKKEEQPAPQPAAQPTPAPQPVPGLPTQSFVIQQFFGAMPTGQNIPGCPQFAPQSAPQPAAQPAPQPAVSENKSLSENEIRAVIRDELASFTARQEMIRLMNAEMPAKEEPVEEVPEQEVQEEFEYLTAEDIKNLISDEVRNIVRTELDAVVAHPAEAVQVPVVAQPVEEELVVAQPVEEEPVVAAPAPQPVSEEEKPKIIRIPFTERVKTMDPEMRANFNALKSEIMSYGVKSRVSNSGDTFRLHTKTYVKVTIAGKSLKLYFALDPKKYENTTLPISDAGHKGIYKEIPLVFKVKSELSLRRAKQLIEDVMAQDQLKQGEIEEKDWIQEIIDTVPEED